MYGGRLAQEDVFENVTVSLTEEHLSLFESGAPAPAALVGAVNGFVGYVDSTGRRLSPERVDPMRSGANGTVFSIAFRLESGQEIEFVLKVEAFNDPTRQDLALENAAVSAAMRDCDLVRYRTWMENEGSVAVRVTLMEKMGDDLHNELFGSTPKPSAWFLRRLAEFLLGVRECLGKHKASFADLKPANIGVNRVGTTVFRLIDIDSVNQTVATMPYFLLPGGWRTTPSWSSEAEKQSFLRATTTFCMLAIAAFACVLGARAGGVTSADAQSPVDNLLNHRRLGGTGEISVRNKVDGLAGLIKQDVRTRGLPPEMAGLADVCVNELHEYFGYSRLYPWDEPVRSQPKRARTGAR